MCEILYKVIWLICSLNKKKQKLFVKFILLRPYIQKHKIIKYIEYSHNIHIHTYAYIDEIDREIDFLQMQQNQQQQQKKAKGVA